MDKLRAQARIGATNLGYGRLRNHKTGKDESGAGHGWHDLTNALLSPPAQSEPNTGELATEQSIIWFAFHHRDQSSPGDEQFVESLTRWWTARTSSASGCTTSSPNRNRQEGVFARVERGARGFSSSKKCPEREPARAPELARGVAA
jgi:hypothetical protein